MKILLLSNSASAHTQKWAKGMAASGIEVGIFSFNKSNPTWYKGVEGIHILHEPATDVVNSKLSSKLGYLKELRQLKRVIATFKPDVVNAHYATSYGLLGRLVGFKPFVISVWGSDVYDFPNKSYVNKRLLSYIFSGASHICSTSESMKVETAKYTSKSIKVVPFGIDASYFEVNRPERRIKTIGIIKSLETKYGIDILIHAFKRVVDKLQSEELELLIVGDGSKRKEYEDLVISLGLSRKVRFTGRVPHNEILKYHQLIDVFVSLSILDSESFGVSLVESMALATPVVASDVSGFKEVLGPSPCGIIVPRNSSDHAAAAIIKYIKDPGYALEKGREARVRANEMYQWNKNLASMIELYNSVIKSK